MEKPVRYCSMLSIALTGSFFLSMFLGAGIGEGGSTGKAYQVVAVIANVLLYVAPIFFLVTLTVNMMCILKRMMLKKDTAVSTRPLEMRFANPVLFVMFLLFVGAIMTAME